MFQLFNAIINTVRNPAPEHRACLLLGIAAGRRPAASILNHGAAELMPFTLSLIGYGHFSAFLHVLAKRYHSDATLKVHVPEHAPNDELFSTLEEADELFFTLEEAIACDA